MKNTEETHKYQFALHPGWQRAKYGPLHYRFMAERSENFCLGTYTALRVSSFCMFSLLDWVITKETSI
jgi:hypothetical protein